MSTNARDSENFLIFTENQRYVTAVENLRHTGLLVDETLQRSLIRLVVDGDALTTDVDGGMFRLGKGITLPKEAYERPQIQTALIEVIMCMRDHSAGLLESYRRQHGEGQSLAPAVENLRTTPPDMNLGDVARRAIERIAFGGQSSPTPTEDIMPAADEPEWDAELLRLLLAYLQDHSLLLDTEESQSRLIEIARRNLEMRLQVATCMEKRTSMSKIRLELDAAFEHAFGEPYTSDDLEHDLFGEPKDFITPIGKFAAGAYNASNAPDLLLHIQGGEDNRILKGIMRFNGTGDAKAQDLLLRFLREKTPIRYGAKGHPTYEQVIKTVATIDSDQADQALCTIATNTKATDRVRQIALRCLRDKNNQVFQRAVHELFRMMDDGKNEEEKEESVRAYHAPIALIGNDEGITDRVIDVFRRESAPSTLVDVLEASTAPEARAAVFEFGLQHLNSFIASNSARTAARYCKQGHGLTESEEQQAATVLVKNATQKYRAEDLIPVLQGAVTDEGIQALMAQKAYTALAFIHPELEIPVLLGSKSNQTIASLRHASGMTIDERNQLLAAQGAGRFLLKSSFSTTCYGPPQTYYPVGSEVDKEIACRLAGMHVLCLNRFPDEEERNEVLRELWNYGLNHCTLERTHERTKIAAAKLILKILKDNNLRYANDDLMRKLEEVAKGQRLYCKFD